LTHRPTVQTRSSNNYAVVYFSSVHTLDAYAHCQKTCSFASLEVQFLLRTFAAQEPTRKMIRQSKSATLGNPKIRLSLHQRPVAKNWVRTDSTLAHFVAPVPAMHSHGAPNRDILVSLPIVPVLLEIGLLIVGLKGPFSCSIA